MSIILLPTFIDVKEDIQCKELRQYFKDLGADISLENSEEGLQIDLQQIISVCDKCFTEQPEDVEAVLNSIVSLLQMVPLEQSENLIYAFCEKMAKTPNVKIGVICLKVLQHLFEGLNDQFFNLRYVVYYNLIKVAGQTDSINHVFSDFNKVKSWLYNPEIGVEKVQKLLRLLHETLDSKQSEPASKVMIELLGTYTEDNASQARDDAHRCIVACLGDPQAFLMDHLLTLKPVRFLEGELIHDLLTIFVSEKLCAYLQFYQTNKDFVHSLGLSHEQNMHKMRLLTFMQLAENKKEISYEILQNELLLKPDDVEAFIIEILRTKLVRAKIDQIQKRVLIHSTMHRTFGKPQWLQLKDVLCKWQENLSVVEGSVQTILQAPYENAAPVRV